MKLKIWLLLLLLLLFDDDDENVVEEEVDEWDLVWFEWLGFQNPDSSNRLFDIVYYNYNYNNNLVVEKVFDDNDNYSLGCYF